MKEELAAEMEKASDALDFERAAVYRDRLAALSAVQAQQGINPRNTEEADVFAVHQEGGFFCVEVFFFRTGQNWGNRAYFPKADRTFGPGEVLGAFLAQFYDDKPVPELVLISHEIEDRALLEEALTTKSDARSRSRSQARREEGAGRSRARQCARSTGPQARRHRVAAKAPRRARRMFRARARAATDRGLRQQPYPGHQRGRRHGRRRAGGFQKNQYRKFNIRSADLTPGDDFAMMREVLERRFKRLMTELPRCPPIWRLPRGWGDGTFGRDRARGLRGGIPLARACGERVAKPPTERAG